MNQQDKYFQAHDKLAIFEICPVSKLNGSDDIFKSIKEKLHVYVNKNQTAMAISKNDDEKIRAIEQAFLD